MKQISHYDLYNESAYQQWRCKKLASYPINARKFLVNIQNPLALSFKEKQSIQSRIADYNFCIYKTEPNAVDQKTLRLFTHQLGLSDPDKHLCCHDSGISEISTASKKEIGEYIPYTNKSINWHTDGYYNDINKKIFAMVLHCESNALTGGENAFIDHDMVYILLRDTNPDYVHALSHERSMIIPENRKGDRVIRPTQIGPVFSIDPYGLHMRYTARTRSIIWRDDKITQQAVDTLKQIMTADTVYKMKHALLPGEGVVSNNVLHMRNEFVDNKYLPRKLYRMRFYQPLFNHQNYQDREAI